MLLIYQLNLEKRGLSSPTYKNYIVLNSVANHLSIDVAIKKASIDRLTTNYAKLDIRVESIAIDRPVINYAKLNI